jgi:hypothetical protein
MGWHIPLVHRSLAPHARPQPPQLPLSVRVSTQVIPQGICPAIGQFDTHELSSQRSSAAHARPQPPQFIAFAVVFTHTSPQRISPAAELQGVRQAPLSHTSPIAHPRPHTPQLPSLVFRSTHAPLQLTNPSEHVTSNTTSSAPVPPSSPSITAPSVAVASITAASITVASAPDSRVTLASPPSMTTGGAPHAPSAAPLTTTHAVFQDKVVCLIIG